ncbi:MAG: hypothetical protein J0647_01115 [Campylobacteraceae bacterium]|nr:hypothetical protein [Campylobacteraceae bacterium]
MFGMILKLQAFMERLKKRKALWFTTITTLAIIGIVGTMYYLNSMTSRTTQNLYEATNASYCYDLESKIADSMLNLEIVGSMLVQNQEFVKMIDKADNNQSMFSQLSAISQNLGKLDKNPIVIEVYNKNLFKIGSSLVDIIPNSTVSSDLLSVQKAFSSQQLVSTIEYEDGKVFLKALYPMQNGILEVKKPVDFLFDNYNINGKIFQVLLDREVLDMRKLQEFKHQKVGKLEISVQSKVDIEFLDKIADLDFDKIIAKKYLLTDQHFILVKPILNIEGKRVGIFVVAENILKDNSLPKMTKKISTGLTTAALGLVVALLVLMI